MSTTSISVQVPGQLWTADEAWRSLGIEFGARMTIVRLPSGGLWLHSPIGLTPSLRDELADLGPVETVVTPSRFHVSYLKQYQELFPQANFEYPASAPRLARQFPAGRLIGSDPLSTAAQVLDWSPIEGSRLYNEVEFFHAPTSTLILTDLLFNLPESHGVGRAVAGFMGLNQRPALSRSFAWSISDRSLIARSLRRLLEWDFDRIILSHGAILPGGGKDRLRELTERFLGDHRTKNTQTVD